MTHLYSHIRATKAVSRWRSITADCPLRFHKCKYGIVHELLAVDVLRVWNLIDRIDLHGIGER